MSAHQGNLCLPDDPTPAAFSGPEFSSFDIAAVGLGFHVSRFSSPDPNPGVADDTLVSPHFLCSMSRVEITEAGQRFPRDWNEHPLTLFLHSHSHSTLTIPIWRLSGWWSG